MDEVTSNLWSPDSMNALLQNMVHPLGRNVLDKIINHSREAVYTDIRNTYDAFDTENFVVKVKLKPDSMKIYDMDAGYIFLYCFDIEIEDNDGTGWYTKELSANMLSLIYKDKQWKISHNYVYNLKGFSLFNILLSVAKVKFDYSISPRIEIEQCISTKDIELTDVDVKNIQQWAKLMSIDFLDIKSMAENNNG